MTPSPKTAEELLNLPELGEEEPIFALRATDEGAVYLFRDGEQVYAPVYAKGQWWKRKQRPFG